MEKENLQKTISDLEKKVCDYQNQIELKVLEKALFIVQVGALTVTTDADGVVKTQNACYPTQFTQTAVNEILNVPFRDGYGGKIYPKIYSRINWYSEKLTELNETFNLITAIKEPQ